MSDHSKYHKDTKQDYQYAFMLGADLTELLIEDAETPSNCLGDPDATVPGCWDDLDDDFAPDVSKQFCS